MTGSVREAAPRNEELIGLLGQWKSQVDEAV